MALGILFILTIVIGILILSTVGIGFFSKDNILNKKWYAYYALIAILVLTIITFTALPSNYIIYKSLTVLLGLLGILGIYLGKTKKVHYKIGIFLISISLLGNFYIGFLM
ncbi:hypothetical protein [Clostridium nigeriense]|uniref:hypothetical protein n=1 Tax=Clostridium nigeriense TaxID=1805470 RepID=UPI00083652A3|nr:hypothetical protein [Clostridium nigeriense]